MTWETRDTWDDMGIQGIHGMTWEHRVWEGKQGMTKETGDDKGNRG